MLDGLRALGKSGVFARGEAADRNWEVRERQGQDRHLVRPGIELGVVRLLGATAGYLPYPAACTFCRTSASVASDGRPDRTQPS